MCERMSVLLIEKRTDVDGTQSVTDLTGQRFSVPASGFKDVLVGAEVDGEITLIEYPNEGDAKIHKINADTDEGGRVFRYLTGGIHTPRMTTIAFNLSADEI